MSTDLGLCFAQAILNHTHDSALDLSQANDDQVSRQQLGTDDKIKKALARRILRAVHPILEEALLRESQLNQLPFENTILDLDRLLETSLTTRRFSDASLVRTNDANVIVEQEEQSTNPQPVDGEAMEVDSDPQVQIVPRADPSINIPAEGAKVSSPNNYMTPTSTEAVQLEDFEVQHNQDINVLNHETTLQTQQAPTPPLSTNSSHLQAQQNLPTNSPERITPLSLGGIPRYMQSFDPSGLTFHEESWSGRDVARDGSEELSELDDIEMTGADKEMEEKANAIALESPRGASSTRGRGKGSGRARGKRGRGRGGRWAKV